MNKKWIIVGILLVFLTLNTSMASQTDNSTDAANAEVLNVSDIYQYDILSSTNENIQESVNTYIESQNKVDFDCIGDFFSIRLLDDEGTVIPNGQIYFNVAGKSYTKLTNDNGVASLQLKLADGTYEIVSTYVGNEYYSPSSKTTTITINNTKVVEKGLSNSEIQKILDSAKINNVILFKGDSYENINLVVSKSLTLISECNTVLKSNSNSPVIEFRGNKSSLSSLDGFNIQSRKDGIYVNGAGYVTVSNNKISTKSNGIVLKDSKNVEISNNVISKNTKSGIVIATSNYTYVLNNKITDNADGISIAESKYTYIQNNIITGNEKGIHTSKTVNNVKYDKGPEHLYINKNTIEKNDEGIYIDDAGDNVKITGNTISNNYENGISLNRIGSNVIQSNVIYNNRVGINFQDDYDKPKSQDISYNAIYRNGKEMEAKNTYYEEHGGRLPVGDNWYADNNVVCPKIQTNNLRFVVTQVNGEYFQATFYDSNGNIASLLPDRTLTYNINGQSVSMTVSGGMALFKVEGNDGDIIKSTVDESDRKNTYQSDKSGDVPQQTSNKNNDISYSNVPKYEIYEDLGDGGDGTGEGTGTGGWSGSGSNSNNADSGRRNSDFTGNGTTNQVGSKSSGSLASSSSTTQSDVSPSSGGSQSVTSAGSESQSVVKQIVIDEEDIYRVTGISIVVLLIILTIGLYYREDIKEMNSKR